jgi:hypothetical protein
MTRRILKLLSIGFGLVLAMAGVASAQGRSNENGNGQVQSGQNGRGQSGKPVAVPEIDPSSVAQAVALLTGGLLMIRGRRRTSSK